MIRDWVYSENMQALKQAECHYISDFEQEGMAYKVDLEQQQVGEIISNLGQDSSIFAEYSRDKYACEVYD